MKHPERTTTDIGSEQQNVLTSEVDEHLHTLRQKYKLDRKTVEDFRPMVEAIVREFSGDVREQLLARVEIAAERRAESNAIRREAFESLGLVRSFVQAADSVRSMQQELTARRAKVDVN